MALTGLEIFKLLPKTNCKKCGYPTCLAFAMAVAAKKVEIEKCSELKEDEKRILLEATQPPIRTVEIGKYKIGGEQVLFRHEKTFFNPPLIGVLIKDTFSLEEVENQLDDLKKLKFSRVGKDCRSEILCVRTETNDLEKINKIFSLMEKILREVREDIVISLLSESEEVIEKIISGYRVESIGGANLKNLEKFLIIAKKHKIPLIVDVSSLEEIEQISERISKSEVKDVIIKFNYKSISDLVENLIQIRYLAIKKNFRFLGFPIMVVIEEEDVLDNIIIASSGILKYAGIIILNNAKPEVHLPLITLRLNIYTDPQKPVIVEPKLYKVGGEPGPDSPLLVTTNFSLTYYSVESEIINSKIPCWLLIVDTDGLSVLTAWAAEKFTPEKIVSAIKKENVENFISYKNLVIPGYVAVIGKKLSEFLPDWKVVIGPKEASGIPKFLTSMWAKDEKL